MDEMTANEQIEKLTRELEILKFSEELNSCVTPEDFNNLKEKYNALASTIRN